MQSSQAPKPFTRMISNVLMALVALYSVINIGVASTCANSGYGSCAFLQALPLFDFIPAINRTVTYLMMCLGRDQAAFALKIFSFTWFTGLIALATMITLATVLSLRTSREERDQTRRLIEAEAENAIAAASATSGRILTKDVARVGSTVIGAVSLVLFLCVFWGYSLNPETGYLRITLHLFFMIVTWSGLLFTSIFHIMAAIERFVLPPSHEPQS